MNKTELNRITITDEFGKEIPFHEFIREVGGSGTIYAKDIRDMFKSWPLADWAYVDDYIAHIAAQVIINASELDRGLYEKIMTVIEEAYRVLRSDVDPNNPTLTRIK